MEYELVLRVVPTTRSETYNARVTISAHEDNRLIVCDCIWDAEVHLIKPHQDSDAHMWALHIVHEVALRLDALVYGDRPGPSVKLMSELHKLKQDLRCRS